MSESMKPGPEGKPGSRGRRSCAVGAQRTLAIGTTPPDPCAACRSRSITRHVGQRKGRVRGRKGLAPKRRSSRWRPSDCGGRPVRTWTLLLPALRTLHSPRGPEVWTACKTAPILGWRLSRAVDTAPAAKSSAVRTRSSASSSSGFILLAHCDRQVQPGAEADRRRSRLYRERAWRTAGMIIGGSWISSGSPCCSCWAGLRLGDFRCHRRGKRSHEPLLDLLMCCPGGRRIRESPTCHRSIRLMLEGPWRLAMYGCQAAAVIEKRDPR